jgi:prepilin-type N-terminal cleavage/methylation domain-containing protein
MSKIKKGFTLLEILLVIATIGILAAIVLVAINPTKQIESANAARRKVDMNNIEKAIIQYSIDNRGQYPNGIDAGAKVICPNTNPPAGCIDLSLLVPIYIASIPQADTGYYYISTNTAGTAINIDHPKDSIWNTAGTPTLDFNFALNKSLIDNVSGNNLTTFTRNSVGTYIGEDGLIKTAAVNTPRFEYDPITGESRGLLVEGPIAMVGGEMQAGGSNLLSTENVPNIIAPDGTNTAIYNYGSGTGSQYQTVGERAAGDSNGKIYTMTVFAKAGEQSRFMLVGGAEPSTKEAVFDVSTGTIIRQPTHVNSSASITPYKNGWYRCSVTFLRETAGTNYFFFYLPMAGPTTYGWTPGTGMYFWGLNIAEDATGPTSYVYTDSGYLTFSRAADDVSITGSNFTNIFSSTNANGTMYGLANSPFSNLTLFSVSAWPWRIQRELLTIGNWSPTAIPSGSRKVAITNGNGANSIYNNGTLYNSNPNVTSASNGTQLNIGQADGRYTNGTISRLVYWPTRLSNTILQSITQ